MKLSGPTRLLLVGSLVSLLLVVGLLIIRATEDEGRGVEAAQPGAVTEEGTTLVRIRGGRLSPGDVQVGVGDTVRWRNEGAETVRLESVETGEGADAGLTSPPIPQGGTHAFRVPQAGEFRYKLVVSGAAPDAGPIGTIETTQAE